jgi:hypothetical protein
VVNISDDINEILGIGSEEPPHREAVPPGQPPLPPHVPPPGPASGRGPMPPSMTNFNAPNTYVPNNLVNRGAYPYQYPVHNSIAGALKVVGWIIIGFGVLTGLIIGLTLSVSDPSYRSLSGPHPLRWVYALIMIISSAVSGLLFLGFSEVINLLENINRRTANLQYGENQGSRQ